MIYYNNTDFIKFFAHVSQVPLLYVDACARYEAMVLNFDHLTSLLIEIVEHGEVVDEKYLGEFFISKESATILNSLRAYAGRDSGLLVMVML